MERRMMPDALDRWRKSKDITPPEWMHVRIVPNTNRRFSVKTGVGFASIGPQAVKALGLPVDLKTENLTLKQAQANGSRIDKAIERVDSALRGSRSKSRRGSRR